ncbi:Scr1 family TA system antitoxin-like transcriptional regulator [Streptomyces sp. NPDC059262]|uniref:helix-turn-helix domain-containing protein n=1 Tax=Streptomyces sp. NPDC059262 TaxID=3346797 RepID=UPI003684B7C7
MPPNDHPPPALLIFGEQSRFLREQRGISRGELAARIPYSESMIAMVERSERPPQPAYIVAVDDALGAQGLLKQLARHVAERDHPAWAQDYVDLQATALALHVYVAHFLHGLLQTEEYARAVFRSRRPSLEDGAIERNVQARLATQSLHTRKPYCRLTFVLEECVVRRMLGGRDVREGQLKRLAELSRLHKVQLQIMPEARECHAGVDGPMTLLETPDHRTMGYVEGQQGGYFVTSPEDVSVMSHRYGALRAQALDTEASLDLIQRLLAGEV